MDGTYTIALRVVDWSGDVTEPDTATLTVGDVNTPPVAFTGQNPGEREIATIGEPLVLQGDLSSDADGDTLTYLWEMSSGPAGGEALFSDPADATATVDFTVQGVYTLTLTVSDGIDTADDLLILSAYRIDNQAPVAVVADTYTADVDEYITLDGSGSFDPDGDDILSRGWAVVGGPQSSEVFLGPRNVASPEFSGNKPGTYTVGYKVSDGQLESETVYSTITVVGEVGEHVPPVADAGQDVSVELGVLATFDGSGSADYLGNVGSLAYQWAITESPAGSTAALVGAETVSPTLTPDLAGEYVVRLIVNDGVANSLEATVHLSVTEAAVNEAPIANLVASAETVAPGEELVFDASATTDDGTGGLFFSWQLNHPNGSTATLVSPATDSFRIRTLVPDVIGLYTVVLTVSDGDLESDPVSATVRVAIDNPDNTPPVASIGHFGDVYVDTAIFLSGAYSYDVDDNTVLTYEWQVQNNDTHTPVELVQLDAASWQLTPTVAGAYTIALVVNDGQANSEQVQIAINVLPSDASLPPDPGAAGRESLTGTDLDGDGIRDDVQRYIAANFSTDIPTRNALQQYARGLNGLLQSAYDDSSTVSTLTKIGLASECLGSFAGDVDTGIQLDVAARYMNTFERMEAFWNFERNVTGYVVVNNTFDTWSSSCE